MKRRNVSTYFLLLILLLVLSAANSAFGQNTSGAISGTVVDSANAVLQGARVELQPSGIIAASNNQGQFRFLDVTPGAYTVRVTFVGFASFSTSITVSSSQTANVVSTLAVAGGNESVLVSVGRAHGEAEAINRELTPKTFCRCFHTTSSPVFPTPSRIQILP